jgi:hypothetical protein
MLEFSRRTPREDEEVQRKARADPSAPLLHPALNLDSMTSPSLPPVPLPHGASSACLGAELPKEPGKLSLFHSIDPDCPDLWLSPGISDGCKIRKIKCTETSPCEGCIKAGIACTFVKHPSARGPRNLRKSTLKEIRQTQEQGADQTHRPWTEIGMVAGEGGPITVPPTVSGLHAGEPGL